MEATTSQGIIHSPCDFLGENGVYGHFHDGRIQFYTREDTIAISNNFFDLTTID
jgi:hypothetical protein